MSETILKTNNQTGAYNETCILFFHTFANHSFVCGTVREFFLARFVVLSQAFFLLQ